MRREIIRARIEALESIKSKAFGILIGGEIGGVIETNDIDEEIEKLWKELEEQDE